MILRKSLLTTSILAATLGLTACGGSSSNDSSSTTPTTPTTPTNAAPTDITLSSSVVAEDIVGAEVGTLTAADDADSGHTFTTDDVRFTIEDGALKLNGHHAMNFEQLAEGETITVKVKVTDAGDLTFEKDLVLSVADTASTAGVNVYEFDTKLTGESGSSVSYTGQTARHALSAEIKSYMGKFNAEYIESLGTNAPTIARARLDALWGDYAAVADDEISHLGDSAALAAGYTQTTFSQISGSGKELSGKIAGADASKMYKDWLKEDGSGLVGWNNFGENAKTPEGLVKYYFDLFESQIQKMVGGEQLKDPAGNVITKAYITPEGLDLVQLVQKHTLGALMFSQGTDDYLDDGLTSQNIEAHKDGKSYTSLEHQYDEGFGYFGASRHYLEASDDEIAKKGGRDTHQGKYDANMDGKIDLAAEFVWGNASNAAKRDRGTLQKDEDGNIINAATNVTTDFTAVAMTNFIQGRKIINDNVGVALTAEQMTQVKAHVFGASLAWEKAIAATVVHYINDSLGDYANIEDGEYTADEFASLAKHWGEMKGFGLNFQFSPFSPFADNDLNPKKDSVGPAKFAELHTLFGDAPVLVQADIAAYKTKLEQAREILKVAYDFNEDNVLGW
ncbi:DUF4856 domain-containing protein [Pseudoalteromonas sp. MMG012]|uniref:DUF4856 domain-containing protein n=1 Tax=Pseudoalteromonas sp. MMG012 TaxID=2822686 RepID=UPI001B3A4D10|nr:DUF4856 domain-containing protein [Pseudoalteromonas sp. MMG012]MBQ4850961.1 DUF4856 domain-containing protein [Pseudoalteromonas sp. MMG012]